CLHFVRGKLGDGGKQPWSVSGGSEKEHRVCGRSAVGKLKGPAAWHTASSCEVAKGRRGAMKFGTLFAYWVRDWKGDYPFFARKVAKLGFDILEVSAGQLLK